MNYSVFETCLLVSGVSRGECAAWVQAWGSVIGIISGVAVIFFQHRLNRKVADAEKKKSESDQLDLLLELLSEAERVFAQLHEKLSFTPPRLVAEDISFYKRQFAAITDSARPILNSRVPNVVVLIQMMRFQRDMSQIMDTVEKLHPHFSHQSLIKVDHCYGRIKRQHEALKLEREKI